ncbi:MAG: thrombospondin type 3 repeat-containing protein [Ghiorsea sp.]
MLKSNLQATVLAVALMVFGQSAYARSSYVTPLNQALATTGLSCNACHNGATNAGTATMLLVAAWKNRGTTPMVQVDSDGDGNSNGIEVRMGTDLNAITSKTVGAAATDGTFVSTAGSVTTAAATDLGTETSNTFTLSGSDTILSSKSISPILPAGSVSLAFEDANILTAKVYQVVGGAATELTPITINSTGSISFTTTATDPKLLVVGTTSTVTTTPQGDASVYGCISTSLPTPVLTFLAMMTLGLLVKRNKG